MIKCKFKKQGSKNRSDRVHQAKSKKSKAALYGIPMANKES